MKNDFFKNTRNAPLTFHYIEGLPKENEKFNRVKLVSSEKFNTNSYSVANFHRPISKIISNYDIVNLQQSGSK